ncbi:ras-related protein Rab-42 isoform X3 [Pan paniscus]|uniref:ras-related protein Rab-42 isoform X2 n=1 Tax=Pan troglodytes TaxID=9598 RepID=UPI0023F1313C|nr:ras-related protein Rab-42 isoform X2 [Pan troglodytes]XP_054951960.1 ras-related protein Rab-42 isoform X2 [Pan paniscus]
MEAEGCRYQFRVALLGDAAVGKTSLLRSYVAGAPGAPEPEPEPEPTVGAECYRRALQLRAGPRVKLQLWDTAGHERFSTLSAEAGGSPEVRSSRLAWPTLVKPCLY